MKKIVCFGNVSEKYQKAIENAMTESPTISGWQSYSDDLPEPDDDCILMKCDIHSDDFLRHVISINKKRTNGEKFYLTHCFVLFNKSGGRQPFILTDAACVPMPDENQLNHIVQNAISLANKLFDFNNKPVVSLISAGGDTNTKISPLLYSWYAEHKKDFDKDALRLEQLDVALDSNVRAEKQIPGNIANIIVVDNINTGNAILKSLSVLSNDWEAVGFLIGAKNTVILNSRSASQNALTKNILLACEK